MGFYCIWILNYGLTAKAPRETLKGEEREPLDWEKKCQQSFEPLKTELGQGLALGHPNCEKPLTLYVCETLGTALGVLTQKLGPVQKSVTHFSKQINPVAQKWPGCWRAVAATALLFSEASKLTRGRYTEAMTPHQVQTGLEVKGTPSSLIRHPGYYFEGMSDFEHGNLTPNHR